MARKESVGCGLARSCLDLVLEFEGPVVRDVQDTGYVTQLRYGELRRVHGGGNQADSLDILRGRMCQIWMGGTFRILHSRGLQFEGRPERFYYCFNFLIS